MPGSTSCTRATRSVPASGSRRAISRARACSRPRRRARGCARRGRSRRRRGRRRRTRHSAPFRRQPPPPTRPRTGRRRGRGHAPGRELPRRLAHPLSERVIRDEQVEESAQRLDLTVVHRHLCRNGVRELREPAHVAHDKRPAHGQRTDDAPRRLAHRGQAEADEHIARSEQRPDVVLPDVAEVKDALVEAEPALRDVQVELVAARDAAGEDEQCFRMPRPDLREGPKKLRDPLRRVQVAEAADHDRRRPWEG